VDQFFARVGAEGSGHRVRLRGSDMSLSDNNLFNFIQADGIPRAIVEFRSPG
jgi:hypothetical protein